MTALPEDRLLALADRCILGDDATDDETLDYYAYGESRARADLAAYAADPERVKHIATVIRAARAAYEGLPEGTQGVAGLRDALAVLDADE